MNILPFKKSEKDKVVIVGQKEIEKKQSFIGSIKPQKGHTLYEVNLLDNTVEEATFEDDLFMYPKDTPKTKGLGILTKTDGAKQIVLQGLQPTSRKIIKKPNCIYISALNKKNVVRKLFKAGLLRIE